MSQDTVLYIETHPVPNGNRTGKWTNPSRRGEKWEVQERTRTKDRKRWLKLAAVAPTFFVFPSCTSALVPFLSTCRIPLHACNYHFFSWMQPLTQSRKLVSASAECSSYTSLDVSSVFPGAQIIDLMMLVVDVVKGMQTQTAECLLIGELTCPRMVVVLNKIDLLPQNKRQGAIEKMTKRLHKTLESTRSALITTVMCLCRCRGEVLWG